MASRLYPTTQRLFVQVVTALRRLGVEATVSPTAFALMALYVTGLILLEDRQTPGRMAAWLPARCHDATNRLLRVMPLSTRQLMKALCRWATRWGTGYLCLDEVVIEKPFSRTLAWCGWIYSFAQRRKVYGLHIVLLVYCVGSFRIPVNFRLGRPKASCRKDRYRTKLQLAERMLPEVRGCSPRGERGASHSSISCSTGITPPEGSPRNGSPRS